MNDIVQSIGKQIYEQLLANGREAAGGRNIDRYPSVKLFTPDAGATWLLSHIDPEDHDRAFGLCDLGLGCPELGWVSLTELSELRGKLGLPVEVDRYFKADKHMSQYGSEARANGRIVA